MFATRQVELLRQTPGHFFIGLDRGGRDWKVPGFRVSVGGVNNDSVSIRIVPCAANDLCPLRAKCTMRLPRPRASHDLRITKAPSERASGTLSPQRPSLRTRFACPSVWLGLVWICFGVNLSRYSGFPYWTTHATARSKSMNNTMPA